jgi:signal transduction histidine kinase
MDEILTEWETFAATRLPAAATMTPLALRDHAKQILEAIAKDLDTFQSREAQMAKSMGEQSGSFDIPETAAETHAVLRAQSGFDINQLAAEYRALRASVLRLWMDALQPEAAPLEDAIRFNEAIDQALAESIALFTEQVDHARNLLLAMLGHDMRTPLQILLLTGRQLEMANAGEEVSEAAHHLINGTSRIKALVDDLLEVSSFNLGVGIRVTPADIDLAAVFEDHLRELRALYADHRLEFHATGDTRAHVDGPRLQRLLDNLVVNAIKYGAPDTSVRIVVVGEAAEVRFEVRNTGPVIEISVLDQIFEPLKRGSHENRRSADGSLGLGLYIAREIARAHGGDITVRSANHETVFTVQLPRVAD